MDSPGSGFGRLGRAAEGWLPLAALASSAWLFYAASDLDAVSTVRPACSAQPTATARPGQPVGAGQSEACATVAPSR